MRRGEVAQPLLGPSTTVVTLQNAAFWYFADTRVTNTCSSAAAAVGGPRSLHHVPDSIRVCISAERGGEATAAAMVQW